MNVLDFIEGRCYASFDAPSIVYECGIIGFPSGLTN